MNMHLKPPGMAHWDELAQLKRALESLPLALDEYGVALNHLNNAQAYLDQGEVGAAWFEMRIVIAKLTPK